DDLPRMPEAGQIESELAAITVAAIGRLSRDQLQQLGPVEIRRLNLARDARNFEEFWINSIGRTLYDKFVDGYSKKMWLIDDTRRIDDFLWSPKGVTIKEGPRAAWDTAMSAFPIAFNGYDDYFRIATAGTRVLLSTEIERFDIPEKSVVIRGERRT